MSFQKKQERSPPVFQQIFLPLTGYLVQPALLLEIRDLRIVWRDSIKFLSTSKEISFFSSEANKNDATNFVSFVLQSTAVQCYCAERNEFEWSKRPRKKHPTTSVSNWTETSRLCGIWSVRQQRAQTSRTMASTSSAGLSFSTFWCDSELSCLLEQ